MDKSTNWTWLDDYKSLNKNYDVLVMQHTKTDIFNLIWTYKQTNEYNNEFYQY